MVVRKELDLFRKKKKKKSWTKSNGLTPPDQKGERAGICTNRFKGQAGPQRICI
jgi:Tfp pilus assembly protein PilX